MAMELAADVYKVTEGFPGSEQFGLTSQTRRAAVSVPSNIAEGFGRNSQGSFAQFLRIAQGSLKELETLVLIADRVGIASDIDRARILGQTDDIGRMLGALKKKVSLK